MEHQQNVGPTRVNPSANATGQGKSCLTKWQLLRAVEGARSTLGLKSTTLTVLRNMVSLIPGDHIDAGAEAGHVCFASNTTLAERAHVSIATVERHIARLIDLGIIERRASGNGKRWARRDRQGRVVLASGLSLLPLVHRHATFSGMAETAAREAEENRLMRDRCRLALVRLREALPAHDTINELVSEARNILRRRVGISDLRQFLARLQSYLPDTPTDNLRDTDTEIEGQKETNSIPPVRSQKNFDEEVTIQQMERSFPKLCRALRFTRSNEACQRTMTSMAQDLLLGRLWQMLQQRSATVQFIILGTLVERREKLRNAEAYGRKLLRDLDNGQITCVQLLRV